MASRYLVPTSGNVDWSSTSSWSATDGGASGASVPGTGDTAYLLRGTAAITSGLNQSTQTPTVVIQFDGSIGTESTSLTFDSATITVGDSSSATVFVAAAAGITVTLFENTSANVYVTAAPSGITARVGGGGLSIAGGIPGGSVYVYGGNVKTTASTVATAYAILMYAGFVTWQAQLDTAIIVIHGGTFVAACAPGGVGSNTISQVDVDAGGLYYHNTSNTISAMYVYAGTASAAGAVAPFTVTNSILTANGNLFQDPPVVITYTNPTTKYATNRSN